MAFEEWLSGGDECHRNDGECGYGIGECGGGFLWVV